MEDSSSAPAPASAPSLAPSEDVPMPIKPSYSAIVQGNGGAHRHPPHLHPFPPPSYLHPPPPPPLLFRVLLNTEFNSETLDTAESMDFVDAPEESSPPSVISNGHDSLYHNKEGEGEGVDCEDGGSSVESFDSAQERISLAPMSSIDYVENVNTVPQSFASCADETCPSELVKDRGNQPVETYGSGLLDQEVRVCVEAAEEPEIHDNFDTLRHEEEVVENDGEGVEDLKVNADSSLVVSEDGEAVTENGGEGVEGLKVNVDSSQAVNDDRAIENDSEVAEKPKFSDLSLMDVKEVVEKDDEKAFVESDGEEAEELKLNADSSQAVNLGGEAIVENDRQGAEKPQLNDLSPMDVKEAVEKDGAVFEEPKMNYPIEATLDVKEVVEGHDGGAQVDPEVDSLLALDSEEVVERLDVEVPMEPKVSDSKGVPENHPNVTKTDDSLVSDTEQGANISDGVSEGPKTQSLLPVDGEKALESNHFKPPEEPLENDSSKILEDLKVNTSLAVNVEEVKEDDNVEVPEILSNVNNSPAPTLEVEEAAELPRQEIDELKAGNFGKEMQIPSDNVPFSEEIKEVHRNGNVDATISEEKLSTDVERTSEQDAKIYVSLPEDAKEGNEGPKLGALVDNEVVRVVKEEPLLEVDHSGLDEESARNLEQCQTDKKANETTDEREESSNGESMDETATQQTENTDNSEKGVETEEKAYEFSVPSGQQLEALVKQDVSSISVNQEPITDVSEASEVSETSGVKADGEIGAKPREEVIVEGEEIAKIDDESENTKLSESVGEAESKIEASITSHHDLLANVSLAKDENQKAEEIIKPKDESEEDIKSSTVQSSTNTPATTVTSAPAGLGSSIPFLEATSRAIQRGSGRPSRQALVPSEENLSNDEVSESGDEAREKLHMIRVKFLRLAHRLGQSAHNVVVAQVLYRLGLAEQLRGGQSTGRTGSFSFERASLLAEEQESAGVEDLDFGCTIMVLGKSGVGKSATINSLFDEIKSQTNAYSPATNKVKEIVGTIHGIKLRVIDTPGLLTSFGDQPRNQRIMSSVKRYIKKSPPDIVLYFDRLDIPSRDYGDLPLLRTITDTFGAAVWFNAIVVLTHASSAPPDGANGVPVSYEMFVAQRSHIVQQTIRQAAGDMRLMNPVSLVENHDSCRRNRSGQRVLPNGQVWKPQLLLLCFASKILAEANSLLKLQDNAPTKPFGVRSRVPPLPFLLSSLLQSRAPLKLPDDQMGGDDDDDVSSEDEDSDSDGEEDYDDLPPFRRLTKNELNLLDKEQKNIYFEELEYRERLFIKKQLKEERRRKKEMKRRMAALPKDVSDYVDESMEEENSSAVAVPMPDMVLPPSFDSDNPTYRYRYLDTPNQFLVRPVLETHGWDHDSGYDGINVEKMFVISKKIPASVSGQITKDKKEANLQMECAASIKNGENKVSQAGLDIQTIGKDLAYTFRGETQFNNFKRNKTTCGLSVTVLGDTVAGGMKVENQKVFGKRAKLVVNGGALTSRSDVAYGGSLEATIRDKDYPIGQFMSTLGLSVMNWHGDLAIGGNLQVQLKAGKTMLITRGNLNNRGAGQISIRASSAEQVQMALIGLIPLLRTLINSRQSSST